MRLVSYRETDGIRPGVVLGTHVYGVEALLTLSSDLRGRPCSTVRELLTSFAAELPALALELKTLAGSHPECEVGEIGSLRLAPPVTDPAKVLCVGLNYADHVAETGRELPRFPDVFVKFASSLIGPEDDIALSKVTEKLDYEGELAIVIGRPTRNVDETHALAHVAGVMVANDSSARDLQYNGTQWTAGKAIDSSTPCGPELVTLDELPDLQTLTLITRVNGEQVQGSSTARMIFPVARIVAYVSSFLELNAGDVILTGTPEGIGSKRTPPSFLAPGDVVEVEITNVGRIRNRVQ